MGGRLRLGDFGSVLVETMVQENSSQGSNDECNGANDHCCDGYSSTCADGSICAKSGLCRGTNNINKHLLVGVKTA